MRMRAMLAGNTLVMIMAGTLLVIQVLPTPLQHKSLRSVELEAHVLIMLYNLGEFVKRKIGQKLSPDVTQLERTWQGWSTAGIH